MNTQKDRKEAEPQRAPEQSCRGGGWASPFLLVSQANHRLRAGLSPSGLPLVLHSPVALPGVADVRVVDAVLVRLLVQKVEHVLDGQGQGRPAVRRAEDGLEQVVHELLQRALRRGPSSDAARPP